MSRADLVWATRDPTVRREWEARLSMGPWLWPPRNSSQYAVARSIVASGPPTPLIGQTPIVSVSRDKSTVALWMLRTRAPGAGSQAAVGFTPDLQEHWREVVSWLPSLLPVLWQPVAGVARRELEAIRLVGWRSGADAREIEEVVLDRPSYGLAFVLVAASLVLGQRLASDFLATAGVHNGKIEPVDAIDLKVRGIRALAPGIRRLLIHKDNVVEAKQVAEGGIMIVPVDSVGAALTAAFGRRLDTVLIKSGRDRASRDELVGRFFSLATGPRVQLIDWTPVRRAAELALDRWALTAAQRRLLRMAAGFAQRHETNGGEVALPDRRWLASLNRPSRLGVLAHLVSQVTYAQSPTPRRMVQIARREVTADLREASVPDLRLLGALARLAAVTGAPADSLRQQKRLAEQYFILEEFEDLSYSLTEWYRLAGALGDAQAFERAARMEERLAVVHTFKPEVQVFVTFARAQGLAGVGRWPEAEPLLVKRAEPQPQAAHLRWSALRWLLRGCHPDGRWDADDTWASRLQDAARPGSLDAAGATFYLALAHLDRAVRTRDQDRARAQLEVVRRLEPGVIRHLETAAHRLKVDGPPYVATFYPD